MEKIEPEDLARGRIASIKHSVSDAYLNERRIYPAYFNNVLDGLRAISQGKVDAMVYDAPLIQYETKKYFPENIRIIDTLFEEQNYGIALPEGSKLREKINRAILETTHDAE